jgi:ATP-dependent RNA helicase DeaD
VAAPAARQPASHVMVFISAGSRDGVTARDLVGAISGESGITSDRIGRIEVRENHSLVEIAPEVAERVVEKMTGVNVKGRRVVARVDRERAPDSDRSRPRSREGGARRPERGERGSRGTRDRGPRGPRGPRAT